MICYSVAVWVSVAHTAGLRPHVESAAVMSTVLLCLAANQDESLKTASMEGLCFASVHTTVQMSNGVLYVLPCAGLWALY